MIGWFPVQKFCPIVNNTFLTVSSHSFNVMFDIVTLPKKCCLYKRDKYLNI